ncbi:hypothetical protein [Streptomyces sp. NBC_00582]|uniref:hypothetical protein n=1 Tax=Streptomyces sp. NBC_00582 TaxID=2975783 RepID=UPI002E81CDDC|nr:hypothetical protein [Streptomyces sp. NBC_00582]WUB64448.1 hypothetical protein OG852_30670 [Streptomyces sp. NBC_00582]
MITLAVTGETVFGPVGAGGLALALSVLLFFGVKGKGKVKFGTRAAGIVAFLAGTSYAAAGQIWANPERVTSQGLTGFGVGTGGGPLGNVGIGAVALVLFFLMLTAPQNPVTSAVLGMISAFVFPAAGDGSIFAVPVEFASAVLIIGGA